MDETPPVVPAVEPTVQPNGKPLRKRKKGKSNVYYVPPAEFLQDIKDYYKSGIISDRLAQSINKIAEGLSFAPNFINYSYKEDMVGDARVKMVAAVKHKKFKCATGNNPFSYFTTIAFHAFINRIKKEKKHHQTICDYQEQVYTDLLTSGEGGNKTIYVDPHSNNDDDN